MVKLIVACFLWDGAVPGRVTYGAEHVRTLREMCARSLSSPHRFVCFADRDVPGVETLPLAEEVLAWGKRFPKLTLWRPDLQDVLGGGRVLALDLDCVITDTLDPLVERTEDVVVWQDPGRRPGLNTSLILMTPGCRPEVWHDFPGPDLAMRAGKGTDQAWVSRVLRGDAGLFTQGDGVYSYRYQCRQGVLREDARLVFFHGQPKPWQVDHAWVREHYR